MNVPQSKASGQPAVYKLTSPGSSPRRNAPSVSKNQDLVYVDTTEHSKTNYVFQIIIIIMYFIGIIIIITYFTGIIIIFMYFTRNLALCK